MGISFCGCAEAYASTITTASGGGKHPHRRLIGCERQRQHEGAAVFTNGRFSGLIFNEPQLQEIATLVRRVVRRARVHVLHTCVYSLTCKLCIVHRDDSALEQNTGWILNCCRECCTAEPLI